MQDTNYYRKVPRESDKPDGVFLAGTRVNIRVGLKDCWFQNLVPGTIKIFNPDGTRGEFATNTDFTFTFVRRYDTETGEWRYPYVSLSAEG